LNISTVELLDWLVKASYLVAATLFLLGLQRMASPLTARSGIRWAGLGMLLATVATFFLPELHNVPLILVALLLGAGLAWWSAGKVAITDMPQMVALYNGMGGGLGGGHRCGGTAALCLPGQPRYHPLERASAG
jgi:NAD(P) transhydrogenase subunit beta